MTRGISAYVIQISKKKLMTEMLKAMSLAVSVLEICTLHTNDSPLKYKTTFQHREHN